MVCKPCQGNVYIVVTTGKKTYVVIMAGEVAFNSNLNAAEHSCDDSAKLKISELLADATMAASTKRLVGAISTL